ncbi:MAG: nicotinamide riboside transporter PnuC [Bacteroidales bacterium]
MDQLLEYFGVITGLLYLYLEIKQKPVMWVIGLITSFVYVFVFYQAKIYADMGLNIYYVLISIYGWILWKCKKEEQTSEDSQQIKYINLNTKTGIGLVVSFFPVYLSMAYVLDRFTDSPIPYADAFTTTLSILATWMLAKRILQHWMLWVFINLISIYIYIYRGLYPTSFLYLCYASLAVVGYINWKKKGVLYEKDL